MRRIDGTLRSDRPSERHGSPLGFAHAVGVSGMTSGRCARRVGRPASASAVSVISGSKNRACVPHVAERQPLGVWSVTIVRLSTPGQDAGQHWDGPGGRSCVKRLCRRMGASVRAVVKLRRYSSILTTSMAVALHTGRPLGHRASMAGSNERVGPVATGSFAGTATGRYIGTAIVLTAR